MSYIFLDDERFPQNVTWEDIPRIPANNWHIVRSYDEFVALLNRLEHIEHVSFDHDLADKHYVGDYSDEKTGLQCAHALVSWCMHKNKDVPNYTVHSMNPTGRANIEGLLEGYKRFRRGV